MRSRALRAAGVLLVACVLAIPAAVPASTVALEISNATADPDVRMEAFDAPAVAFGDFDGDGSVEVVAHNDNQRVYVLSTEEPRVLAELRPQYPDGWDVRPLNSPSVTDVDGDGRLDVVVVNSAAVACRYEFDPDASTATDFAFVERWCRRADAYDGFGASADGGPWVEDVDGDGLAETFVQTEQRGYFAWRHDGTLLWKRDRTGGNAEPLVTDLEGDGRKEAVFFGDAGEVRVRDARTGDGVWTFHASAYVWPASIPVSGSAADLDGDGRKEVVFTARQASHTDDWQENDLMVFVLRHDGSLAWRAHPSWGNPMSYTHPALADVDADGDLEILLMDWNTIGHKPGDWSRLGPANVFAYAHDGVLLWRTEVDNSWSNDDLVVADADGDGALEVLAIGWGHGGDGVWQLDARTGAKERHVAVGDWHALRGPWAADLDGQPDLEWLVSVHRTDPGGGFLVFDTDAPCDVAFGAWQLADPCDPPAAGEGTGGTDEGAFDASFSKVSGNEWWVQVHVDANLALASVDARVDGGAWKPLELKWWGDWAASVHVPDGSVVEFRATSTSGAHDLSGGYRWPGHDPVEGGDPGFAATFSDVSGNEWWVQVDVDANADLAGVDARVDGGAWQPLELKWWGDWAASVHVPDGSVVEFRARATSGAEAFSGGWRWPGHEPVEGGDDGSGFEAAFRNVRGNEWWVETDVDANEPLAGVEARVDGGAWFALEPTDWGSWARTARAEEGSLVQFRATSEDGDTATSAEHAWPP